MKNYLLRCSVLVTLLASAPVVVGDSVSANSTATTGPAPAAASTDARYATPTAVIKTLALAIESGNGKSICRCVAIQGHAGRAAVAAFANISSASESFTKTAVAKLGTPPSGMAHAFGSIKAGMDRLLALLPKAVVTIHGTAAQVTFPASATGPGQTIFVRQSSHGWHVDGARLLHLNQRGITASAVQRRAAQLNSLTAALNQTTSDINSGKIKTWMSLEKDMELHILEAQAAMESRRQAQSAPPVMTASPPPPPPAK